MFIRRKTISLSPHDTFQIQTKCWDSSLRYSTNNRRGKPPIIFFHGANVGHKMWHRCMSSLSNFHCLSVDIPGIMSKDPALSSENYVAKATESLKNWLEDLDRQQVITLNDGISLVGHSFGGLLALNLASQLGEQVSDVMVCNAMGFNHDIPLKFLPLKYSWSTSLMTQFVPRTLPGMTSFLGEFMVQKENLSETAETYYSEVIEKGGLHPFYVINNLNQIKPLSDNVLRSITARTLVITGDSDPIVPEEKQARTSLIDNSQLIQFLGCGHVTPIEHPKLLAKVFNRFHQGHLIAPDPYCLENGGSTIPVNDGPPEEKELEERPLDYLQTEVNGSSSSKWIYLTSLTFCAWMLTLWSTSRT